MFGDDEKFEELCAEVEKLKQLQFVTLRMLALTNADLLVTRGMLLATQAALFRAKPEAVMDQVRAEVVRARKHAYETIVQHVLDEGWIEERPKLDPWWDTPQDSDPGEKTPDSRKGGG